MQLGTRAAITRRWALHRPIYFLTAASFQSSIVFKAPKYEIVVSITPQSVHGGRMARDATARVIDASLWGLAFLILGGTILAFLLW